MANEALKSATKFEFKSLSSKKGQLVGGLMGLLIAIIIVVAVVVPITIQVVAGLNITGPNASLIKTLIDLVPVLVAVLAIIVVVRVM